MKLTDFIMIQNRELVETAYISFKLLLPLKYGGKWFFYCERGDTVEDLCNWVKKSRLDINITWPDNQVSIEENGEDENGKKLFKYVFDLNSFPDDEDLLRD